MYQLYNRPSATAVQLEYIDSAPSAIPHMPILDFTPSLQSLRAPLSTLLSHCAVAIVILGLCAGLYECYQFVQVLLLRRKLPPGPFPLPIVGNRLEVLQDNADLKYEEWKRKYGSPLITIWRENRPYVVLVGTWIVHHVPGLGIDAYPVNQSGSFDHHRVLELQSNHAKNLTMDLLNHPNHYPALFRQYAHAATGGLCEEMSFQDGVKDDNAMTRAVARHMTQASIASSGPRSPWDGDIVMQNWITSGYRYIDLKTKMQHGRLDAGYDILRPSRKSEVDDLADRLISAVEALSGSPVAQATARAEIEAVVGHSRPPCWADLAEDRLPHVFALAKNWCKDTQQDGVPSWTNEEERVLLDAGGSEPHDPQGEPREKPTETDSLHSGRISGDEEDDGGDEVVWRAESIYRRSNERIFLLALARLLWAFTIEPDLKETSKAMPEDAFTHVDVPTGCGSRVSPVRVGFRPRSKRIEDLIEFEAQEAAAYLRRQKST